MTVRFARRAILDIAEIEAWIEGDNPHAAERLAKRLVSACHALRRFPRRYPAIEGTPFRKRPVGAYVIFYRVVDGIEIVRVLHSARDWPTLLQGND